MNSNLKSWLKAGAYCAAICGAQVLLHALAGGGTFDASKNPFEETDKAGDTIKSLAMTAAVIMGGLACVIGACICGWKAVKGEDFVKNLIFAIIGFVLAAIATFATFEGAS